MPAVISDTSVIHYLAVIGHTDLLCIQFGQIFVPSSVWRELHFKSNSPGAVAADSALEYGWLVIKQPKPSQILNQLLADLDAGEAEAIALAYELKPAVVLLDEADGRAEARRLDLPIIGTAGILARARESGHLHEIKPLLDCLMHEYRFRLSRKLYDQLIAGDKAD